MNLKLPSRQSGTAELRDDVRRTDDHPKLINWIRHALASGNLVGISIINTLKEKT